ncbi:ROK family protein [Methylobrevis pamukkalensis]|uniref:Glucokinase n=1 Tax=Methylobrevis pamukkalensis TaxID=1439726 RepID=A0A1E3H3Q2_9HYPH|nr:ROK family protein [Methylobrevis pamukkalensis]ODN70930.1 Glucokinase [Methylobrevis pamukkalensis]
MRGIIDDLGFPVLFADIGGTNARFALLADAAAPPVLLPSLQTRDHETLADALANAILPLTDVAPRTLMFAVAGPIQEDRTPLTNCHWVVEPRALIARFDLARVMLFNDFEALALALPTLGPDDLTMIGHQMPSPTGNKIVVGPGTGLGAAGLVRAGGTWVPIAGEGGHIDLAPATARDAAIWPNVERIDGRFDGRFSGETLICGSGLVRLYQAIARTDAVPAPCRTPAEVTAAAEAGDPTAHETVELFCDYLGRTVGNLALVFLAHGGVYLAGGIAPRLIEVLRNGRFRAAFEDKAPHQALLAAMGTGIITHAQPALAGLIGYARSPRSFLLDLDGRDWSI